MFINHLLKILLCNYYLNNILVNLYLYNQFTQLIFFVSQCVLKYETYSHAQVSLRSNKIQFLTEFAQHGLKHLLSILNECYTRWDMCLQCLAVQCSSLSKKCFILFTKRINSLQFCLCSGKFLSSILNRTCLNSLKIKCWKR